MLIALLTFGVAGCWDDPTASEGGSLRISAPQTTLTGPGDSVRLTVWVESTDGTRSDPPSDVSFQLHSELRRFPGHPVLSSSAIERGVAAPSAPGVASIQAVAEGFESVELEFHVEPEGPVVAGVVPHESVTEGDILRIRGLNLSPFPVSNVFLPGVSLEMVEQTDSTLELRLSLTSDQACGPIVTRRLWVGDAWLLDPRPLVSVAVPGATAPAPIELAPGETYFFPNGECLRLPPVQGHGGGQYLLVYVDPRSIRAAANSPERFDVTTIDFPVTVVDESAPAAQALRSGGPWRLEAATTTGFERAPVSEVAIRGEMVRLSEDPLHFLNRREPWVRGDVFSYDNPRVEDGAPALGTVVRVFGDYLVLGVLDEHLDDGLEGRLARVEQQMDSLLIPAIEFLSQVYSANRPVTTPGSRQLFVLLTDTNGSTSAGSYQGQSWAELDLQLAASGSPIEIGDTNLLEMLAYLWQQEYFEDRRAEGPYGVSSQLWGAGGSRTFAAQEILRLTRGVSFDANIPLAQVIGEEPATSNIVWRTIAGGGPINSYRFANGFASSAWFLRDLTQRSVREGHEYSEVITEVQRGASDGWFGLVDTPNGLLNQGGLYQRMVRFHGADWDPVEALLLAAGALFADDLTSNEGLQVPTIANTGYPGLGPLVQLREAENNWVDALVNAYAFGYIELLFEDGGDLNVMSPGVESEWLLIRMR